MGRFIVVRKTAREVTWESESHAYIENLHRSMLFLFDSDRLKQFEIQWRLGVESNIAISRQPRTACARRGSDESHI